MSTQRAAIDWESARRRVEASERALQAVLSPDEAAVREVLGARAKMLAERRAERRVREEVDRYLLLRARSSTLALDLTRVTEVGPLERCTPVPGGPASLVGVFAHRGEVHSLVDLGVLLGSEPSDGVRLGFFVHLRPPRGRSGESGIWLRVDELDRVAELNPAEIAPIDGRHGLSTEMEEGALARCVEGVASDGVFVLRLEALWKEAAAAGFPQLAERRGAPTGHGVDGSSPASAGSISEAHP